MNINKRLKYTLQSLLHRVLVKGFSILSKVVDALASDVPALSKSLTIISWLSDRCLYKSMIQDACEGFKLDNFLCNFNISWINPFHQLKWSKFFQKTWVVTLTIPFAIFRICLLLITPPAALVPMAIFFTFLSSYSQKVKSFGFLKHDVTGPIFKFIFPRIYSCSVERVFVIRLSKEVNFLIAEAAPKLSA